MFCKNDSKSYREILPGIGMKAMVYGENTLMTEFSLKGGSVLPAHNIFMNKLAIRFQVKFS